MGRKEKKYYGSKKSRKSNKNNLQKAREAADETKKTHKVPSISYFTLYRFASRWDKFLLFISILGTVVAGIILPYAITLVAAVFQNMITYAKDSQKGVADADMFLSSMHAFGLQYSGIGCILFMGGYLGSALARIAALNQIFKLRQEYLRCALNQDFAYFDMYQTGDFASKMADDIIKVEEGIGDKVSSFVFNLTVAVACILMAMVKGWKLALLCLTTTPITFLLVGLTGKIADTLSKKGAVEKGQASAIAEEVLSSIRTVYAFSGQKKELERYRLPLGRARRIFIKKDLFTGLSMGFLYLCVFCSYALAFYTGTYLIVNDPDHYNVDVMFSVFFGVMTAVGNFGMVGSLVATFGTAKGAGAQIFQLLDNVPTINPLRDRGLKPVVCEGNVDLNDVVFHYPSRPEVPILKGVSVSVKCGQTVALVGGSGCGKSTIIQLICRFYDVIDGNVSVDGNDVRELSVSWLRSQIGLVGQQPVLFNASIRDNIRYGREDATDNDIEAAAEQAFAHRFITKLPKGYDTFVGESGAALSGGQKQRIAIARALIRNPKVLLLDEATSALDLSSEAKVQKALDKAAKGRTTIIVAHRLSTIRNADLIYVMKDGRVVEKGNHEELMSLHGVYADIVELQDRHEPTNTGASAGISREESKMADQDSLASIEVVDSFDEEKRPTPKASFWRVIRLNAPEWKCVAVGCVCSIVLGFSMPLFIVIFGDLLGSMSNPDAAELMGKVEFVSLCCVLLGLGMGIANFIEAISFGAAGEYLTERLRVLMFEHMLRQHVAFFDDQLNSIGALCARLSGEAARVQSATGQRIGVVLQGIGSIGLAVVVAMVFEWRVGLVAMAFLPVVAVVIYYQSRAMGEESRGDVKSLENSTMIAVEAVTHIRTVASLGRERRVLAEYAARLRPALPPARRAAHCRGLVAGLSRSMFNFINAAALTYGGHLIVSEGVAYENIVITTQALQMASSQAQNAFTYAPDFQKGVMAASRIIEFLNSKPKIVDPENPIKDFKAAGEASFTGVEFRYPNRPNVRVLRGLDLHLERGTTVALVGQSGCGKSTVVQLLERFYDADAGVVALDNVPLRQLRIQEVRAPLGLVSQEPVLFDRTISENIAYGDNSTTLPHDLIVEAAKQANIHSFVVALPQGYETNIGSKGTQLSGGQKQRVAIARALVRNPKILLLDEATSALDSESEKVVQEALDRGRIGRSCVTIAHRLSTVYNADLICLVSEGCVAESGTHTDLMARKGLYYKLHNASAN